MKEETENPRRKDDIDQAKDIVNRTLSALDKEIALDPKREDAYFRRGLVHFAIGNHDKALKDFDQAIALGYDDPGIYSQRGLVYLKTGKIDKALCDFNKAIEHTPEYANTYSLRGLAHLQKGDTNQALLDFNEAIQLNTRDATAYASRGTISQYKDDYGAAIDDFVEADKLDPNLKFRSTVIYIASRVNTIFGTDKRNRNATFVSYCKLLNSITRIQEKLFYSPQEKEVAHYTSLHTLKSLVEKSRFRLYNVAYMNDPEEGRVFFEIMKELQRNLKDVEFTLYGKSEDLTYRSPAYIGSFIKLDSSERAPRKDKLFLWRTYGKHDIEEAAGSCLIFRRMCFAENYEFQSEVMHQSTHFMKEKEKEAAKYINLKEPQNTTPSLYRVVYRGGQKYKDVYPELQTLASLLDEINRSFNSVEEGKKRDELKEITRELLDRIRFLFKETHYSEEHEVRVMNIRYYGENMTQKSDGIKVDAGRIPPRFYLETPESFRFSEVILGPRTKNVQEWKRWIKEWNEDVKVEKSEIPYRNPS